MKRAFFLAAFALALACHALWGSPQANARMLTIPTYSFESPDYSDTFVEEVPSGWTTGGGPATYQIVDPTNSYYSGTSHDYDDTLPGDAVGTQYVAITQDVPGSDSVTSSLTTKNPIESIAPNTTYTLTVALGNRVGDTGSQDPADTIIELLAGGVVVASDSFSAAELGDDTFADHSIMFDTTTSPGNTYVGDSLKVGLSHTVSCDIDASQRQGNFDNVRLQAQSLPIPEPNALALVCLGLSMLLSQRAFTRRAR